MRCVSDNGKEPQVKALIIGLSLLATTAALAQQQTPNEQALGTKLMQEIQGGLNCSASLITLQAELAKAQARVKELEAKAEEKK
jgi:hypothetical protein